ncbi:MAG: 2OG-Fe(II) oxygenase family protein [Pseudomonadota bacterium]
MFQDTAAWPLFPTHVWVHDLKPEDSGPMNQRLLQAIERILTPRPPIGPGQSWQTDPDLHRHEDFAELMPYVNQAAQSTLEFLQVEYESFQLTGCWANINPSGTPHAGHSHPNNFLSGVYYVHCPAGGDTISFHDPRPQTNIIAPRVLKHTNENTSPINLPAKEGRLLVFPAWFRHSVLPNKGQGDRISISFNVMFSSFAETISPPKWQGIPTGKTRTR